MNRPLATLLLIAISTFATAEELDLSKVEIIDLTHPYNAETIYWPSPPAKFELERMYYGKTDAGFFYSANRFCTEEHGGTHIDAPIHFGEGKLTVDQIPLRNLIGQGVVIDISKQAAADPDYRLLPSDIEKFEAQHGRIQPGTIVLLRTDWSKRWPDRKAYMGDDTPDDTSKLHFPGYGVEAATMLIDERKVAAFGVDTASIDHGQSKDFKVHQIVAAANVPGLENLTGLEALPALGFTLIALPMKIEGGSGGPVRVVALLSR